MGYQRCLTWYYLCCSNRLWSSVIVWEHSEDNASRSHEYCLLHNICKFPADSALLEMATSNLSSAQTQQGLSAFQDSHKLCNAGHVVHWALRDGQGTAAHHSQRRSLSMRFRSTSWKSCEVSSQRKPMSPSSYSQSLPSTQCGAVKPGPASLPVPL